MWQGNHKGTREGVPWSREWGERERWGDWEEMGEVGERPSCSFGEGMREGGTSWKLILQPKGKAAVGRLPHQGGRAARAPTKSPRRRMWRRKT